MKPPILRTLAAWQPAKQIPSLNPGRMLQLHRCGIASAGCHRQRVAIQLTTRTHRGA
jgi:hypothetical protein